MNIIIPFNTLYIKQRYNLPDTFIELLSNEVVPSIVSRFSMDSRVETIEIISDIDLKKISMLSNKVFIRKYEIDDAYDPNEVVSRILEIRQLKSEIIVQVNPLYPFVSIDSLFRAYTSVKDDCVRSAVGAFRNKVFIDDEFLINEYDRGIFNVYKEKEFKRNHKRVSLPFDAVGLRAVELICLRNQIDIELFDLVVNSGFEQ